MIKNFCDQLTDKGKARAHVLLLVLLLAPFFQPGYISVCVPAMDLLYKAGKVVSALLVLAMGLKEVRASRRLSGTAIALIAMEIWMLVNTLINRNLQGYFVVGAMSVLVVCALIELQMRRHARELLEAFLILFEVLILINFASQLLFPEELYETKLQWDDNWFLGYRNMFIFYYAPALTLELVKRISGGSALRFYGMLAVCAVSMVMAGSATGLLAIAAFLVLCLTGLYRTKIVNSVTVTLAGLAAFASIVLLNFQMMFQPVFDLLGRQVTFTGRTTIWEAAKACIAKKPIVGYGVPEEALRIEMMNHAGGVTAHNFILEVLFSFGVIGLCLTVVLMGILVVKLYKNRKHPYAGALCVGLACFHLVMLMEGEINNVPMYMFFFLTCFVDQLIRQLPVGEAKKA